VERWDNLSLYPIVGCSKGYKEATISLAGGRLATAIMLSHNYAPTFS